MSPTLETPDGTQLDTETAQVNQEFSRAMAADAKTDAAAPPKRPASAEPETPRRRGRPPGSKNKSRVESRPAAPAAAAAGLSDDERATGVTGLVQIGAGLCLVAARSTGRRDPNTGERVDNLAFKADAITLANSAEDMAAAVVATAKADARFGALVDKVCQVGPYGALISVLTGVGMQLARNHRPAAALPGTVAPAELVAAAEVPAMPVAA